jgi:hypothetical protein
MGSRVRPGVLARAQEALYGPVICRIFAKKAGILFDVTGQCFYQRKESDLEYLSPETLLDQFTSWLQQWANRCGTHFPVNELRLPRVRSMIQELKLVAAGYEPDPLEGLEQYTADRICSKPDGNLSGEEAEQDYLQYAAQRQIGRYPLCQFRRQFPKIVQKLFGAVRAHNLLRWSDEKQKFTSRRGFNGLAFRDGKDAADASDVSLKKTP